MIKGPEIIEFTDWIKEALLEGGLRKRRRMTAPRCDRRRPVKTGKEIMLLSTEVGQSSRFCTTSSAYHGTSS